jgi:hypothetical protein
MRTIRVYDIYIYIYIYIEEGRALHFVRLISCIRGCTVGRTLAPGCNTTTQKKETTYLLYKDTLVRHLAQLMWHLSLTRLVYRFKLVRFICSVSDAARYV